MIQRFLSRQPSARIVAQHAFQQVKALVTQRHLSAGEREFRKHLSQLRVRVPLESHLPHELHLTETRPAFIRGCSKHRENLVDELKLRLSFEQRLPREKLCHDAAHGPHVNRRRVDAFVEKQLGGSVPQGHNELRVLLQRRTVCSSQTEIADFHLTLVVVQYVGCLQVPVEDPLVMHVREASQELLHHRLHFSCRERLPHILQQSFEVVLHELHDKKYRVETFPHDDLAHVQDIRVLERQQDVDLAHRSQREPFLLLRHLYLLQGNDFA
mmetsp:Transcript_3156/g.5306  ORF Transcript_3156/g.5306 Transcript_3156/m.5306 type:complete len:269 (-) Transcript_3156:354-1160(-)